MPAVEVQAVLGFDIKNCGPFALEQLNILIRELRGRGVRFLQAREAAALA